MPKRYRGFESHPLRMTTGKIVLVMIVIILACVGAIFGIIRLTSGPEDFWYC
ncbi:MAG: hypothetical protein PHE24_06920 [Patescibacteria group bacterium]|nr:hypothetical protein [Patescibacteria group bacterium]